MSVLAMVIGGGVKLAGMAADSIIAKKSAERDEASRDRMEARAEGIQEENQQFQTAKAERGLANMEQGVRKGLLQGAERLKENEDDLRADALNKMSSGRLGALGKAQRTKQRMGRVM